MEDFKDKTVLIYDEGIFLSLAIRLSRDFGRTLYFSNWVSEYPVSKDDMVGVNILGIERVSEFWSIIDEVDLFVFPSIYHGDLQIYLDSIGKRVWGSRNGDELERFRIKANEHFKALDLPRPTMVKVKGFDALVKHLKANDNKFIKVSDYRGNGETWFHTNYELSEPILDEISHHLGSEKYVFEWIIEDPISGDDIVETGYDGYCIDGEYPSKTIFGYEKKDAGYICHVKEYDKMSPIVTDFNTKVSETLKKYNYRNFMSTEIRVGKDKVPYMIDFTARMPSPPGELYIEMVSNLAEIVWYGASGILIEPEFEAKYGIQVMIDSDSAKNKWHNVFFPNEIERWVKLRNYTIINDTYCIIPRYPDFNNIGALIAFGDTMDECIELIKERAEMIKGYDVEVNISSIDKMQEIIKNGEKLGLSF